MVGVGLLCPNQSNMLRLPCFVNIINPSRALLSTVYDMKTFKLEGAYFLRERECGTG